MPREICNSPRCLSIAHQTLMADDGEHYTGECPIDIPTFEEADELADFAEQRDITRWNQEQEDLAYEAWRKSRNKR